MSQTKSYFNQNCMKLNPEICMTDTYAYEDKHLFMINVFMSLVIQSYIVFCP